MEEEEDDGVVVNGVVFDGCVDGRVKVRLLSSIAIKFAHIAAAGVHP